MEKYSPVVLEAIPVHFYCQASLIIKWSCKIANTCRKGGYETIRSILPIPSWKTTKQYRQATSTTDPISRNEKKRL